MSQQINEKRGRTSNFWIHVANVYNFHCSVLYCKIDDSSIISSVSVCVWVEGPAVDFAPLCVQQVAAVPLSLLQLSILQM